MSLDIEQSTALVGYLRSTGRIGTTEQVRTRVLAGGVSNRTVLVELPDRPDGACWVLKQALAKLRVKVDWFSDPARIGREALGLRYLATLAPPGATMPLIFEDPANHLLAMAAVPEPHENWKAMLLAGRVEEDHVRQFGALLGAIHRRAAESDEPLRELFDDRSYFESLRLEPYYGYAAEQVPQARDFLQELIADIRRRRMTLVHGDYSPKNVLIHRGRLVLLDHEVVHWGDPAFDVGFALTHLLSKAHHLPAHRASLARAAERFCQTYADILGPTYWDAGLETAAVRHTLGCLLARVAGRSPLEYLTDARRERQRAVVVAMMGARRPLASLRDFIGSFLWGITDADDYTTLRP